MGTLIQFSEAVKRSGHISFVRIDLDPDERRKCGDVDQSEVLMNDWFEAISATCALPADAALELQHRGFTVIPDAVPRAGIERLSRVCDAAMSSACADSKIGSAVNATEVPRRSLQGAFIPRDGKAGDDFAARLHPETRARLSSLAQYVLAI